MHDLPLVFTLSELVCEFNKKLLGRYRPLPHLFLCPLSLPGRGGTQLRRFKPVCPPKPPDLAQRPKVPGGRVSLPNLTHASSSSSLYSCASSTSESSNTSFRHPLQRRNPVIPDTVKLPPGVHSQSAASSPTQTPPGNHALKYFRRRETPGRRKDSTQSLYIDGSECDLLLHFSSCPPSASSSSTSISVVTPSPQKQDTQASKGKRRFSDPDIPFIDDDV